MKPGEQVVRVSVESGIGRLGERGRILQVYTNTHDGSDFGYNVEWRGEYNQPPWAQFVAAHRVVTQAEWEMNPFDAERKAHA